MMMDHDKPHARGNFTTDTQKRGFMNNKTIFESLEKQLHKRYKAFKNQDLFCEWTDKYFVVNCNVNWHRQVNKNYYNWIIPFIKKHLEAAGYTGYFYFIDLTIKIGE